MNESTKFLHNVKFHELPVECYYSAFDENTTCEFYRGFTLNDMTYTVGNFILINSGDEIGKIFCIFANEKEIVKLIVRKYIFARNVKDILLKDGCMDFDEDNEIIEDFTKDYVIQVDEIIKKCNVVFGQENESFDIIKESNLDSSLFYFCRYCLKSDGLFPLLSTSIVLSENNLNSPIRKSCSVTKQKRKYDSENIECAVNEKLISPKNSYKNVKISTNDVIFSPVQRNSVKRNLNESFGACPGETNNSILNYSIVSDEEIENPLVLKLRISESSKKPVVLIKKLNENSTPKEICEQKIENIPIRKSTRKIQRKSYADYISPIKYTPRKRTNSHALSDEDYIDDSRNSFNKNIKSKEKIVTPRKSDLKEEIASRKRIIKTPKRYQNELQEAAEEKSHSVRRSLRLTSSRDVNQDVTPRSSRKSKRGNSSTSDTDVESNSCQDRTPQKKINLDESIRRSVLRVKINRADLEQELTVSNNLRTRRCRSKSINDVSDSIESDDSSSSDNRRTIPATTPRSKVKPMYEDTDFPIPLTPKVDKNVTPKKNFRQTPKSSMKLTPKTPRNRAKLIREGIITPSMQSRSKAIAGDSTPLMKARSQLHVSYVPKALPCREKEYCDVFNFLEGKLLDGCGGCMYISGVPGTGKTATVSSVISNLQQNDDIPKFNYVSINGMRLTESRQAYVEILKQLTGKTVPWEQAQTMLEEKFTKSKKMAPTVMLVDELDILCTKRQDVVYNLLDWPTKAKNQLIVITIANTMDLPERLLMSRVTSRLGLTRLTFQAYTHKQLQEIVTKRLSGTDCFNPDAIQFVARKVASVSGDARRALDICRRAAEIAESQNEGQLVNMGHVNEALNAMITQPKVRAIKNCSRLEQLILQSIVAEVERTGVEETNFSDVFKMLVSCAAIEGFKMVSSTCAFSAISRLSACRLILSDPKYNDISQKIILNVSVDDVYYALKKDHT